MKSWKIIILFAIALMVLFPSRHILASEESISIKKSDLLNQNKYKSIETQRIIETINSSAELIRTKGRGAINEIIESNKSPGNLSVSLFSFKGDAIIDLDGNPSELNNSFKQLNIESTTIKDMIKEEAYSDTEAGWVHYKWMRRDRYYPEWKSSLVRTAEAPDGEKFILSCGDFNLPPEDIFMVDFVDDFISFLKKNDSITPDFNNKTYRVSNYMSYIYIINDKSVMLHNVEYPNLDGRDLYNYKDCEGRFIFREIADAVKDKDHAWVEYHVQTKNGHLVKRTYISRVNNRGENLIVASGYILK